MVVSTRIQTACLAVLALVTSVTTEGLSQQEFAPILGGGNTPEVQGIAPRSSREADPLSRGQFLGDAPAPNASRSDQQPFLSPATIRLGRGAVEFESPANWFVFEVPHGREIRVVLTPDAPPDRRQMPIDGAWFVCHSHNRFLHLGGDAKFETMQRHLTGRLATLAAGLEPMERPITAEVSGFPLLEQGYGGSVAGRDSYLSVTGKFVLIATDWGILEYHHSVRVERQAALEGDLDRLVRSISLGPLLSQPAVAQPTTLMASPILGTWKSYRAQLRLRADGYLELKPDQVQQLIPPQPAPSPRREADRPLKGDFQAESDILRIRWQDGSLLNYRWKLDGDRLLLTDHTGRMTHLRRVIE